MERIDYENLKYCSSLILFVQYSNVCRLLCKGNGIIILRYVISMLNDFALKLMKGYRNLKFVTKPEMLKSCIIRNKILHFNCSGTSLKDIYVQDGKYQMSITKPFLTLSDVSSHEPSDVASTLRGRERKHD